MKNDFLKHIEFIMISYKWNFLAEACLETIKFPIRIIHSDKNENQIKNFYSRYACSNETIKETLHFKIIETILNENKVDKPYVLFIDHDMIWHNNSFDTMLDNLYESYEKNPDALLFRPYIDSTHHAQSSFNTAPCFLAKRDSLIQENQCWLPNYGKPWEKYKDTGQELASKLASLNEKYVNIIDLNHIDFDEWHLGSAWKFSLNKWKNSLKFKDFKHQIFIRNKINNFIFNNDIKVSDEEKELLKDYAAFSYYLNYKKIEEKNKNNMSNKNINDLSVIGIMHIGKNVNLDYFYFERLKKLTDKTVVLLENTEIDIDADYIITLKSKEELKWNDMMNRLFSVIAAANLKADWILTLDSDEDIDYRIKNKEDLKKIIFKAEESDTNIISFALRELWEKRDEYRSDGKWGRKRRPRLIKNLFKKNNLLIKPSLHKRLHDTPNYYNVKLKTYNSIYEIYHYGCFTKELREKRVEKYRKQDPSCLFQNDYNYMIDYKNIEIKKIDGINDPNS